MQRRSLMLSTLASAVAGTLTAPVWAQGKWPTKPISYIVPFPAGGTTDIVGRLIGQKLGPVLGTTIVVDNRGGAGGSVGLPRVRPPMATRCSAAPSAHMPSMSAFTPNWAMTRSNLLRRSR